MAEESLNSKTNEQLASSVDYKSQLRKQVIHWSTMKLTVLLLAGVLAFLFVIPSSETGACGCSSKRELPEKQCDESESNYYKRVFVLRDLSEKSISQFYEDVFYEYKGESNAEYVKRIDKILGKYFTSIDCRQDYNLARYLEKYYRYKYIKNSNENDEEYFKRVLVRQSESDHKYQGKVELLNKFVQNVDWNKVSIDYSSKSGFTFTSKSTSESRKSSSSTREVGKIEEKDKKEKKVTIEKKEKTQKTNKSEKKEKLVQKEKSGKKENKTTKNKEISKSEARKVENKVNVRTNEAKRIEYGENVQKLEAKKKENEENVRKIKARNIENDENLRKAEARKREHEENVQKLEAKKKEHKENVQKLEAKKKEHENNVRKIEARKIENAENVKKIEARKIEHDENVRKIEDRNVEHNENVRKIEARKVEHEENVRKIEARNVEHDENIRKIEARKVEHEENVRKIEARNIKHDENVRKIEAQKVEREENIKKIEARKVQREENIKKWIRSNYRKRNDETNDGYYKRICSNTFNSEEEYIERVSSVRSVFQDLDLWYDKKYLSETQKYYTLVYSKKTTESDDAYFQRILTKESYESEEHFAKRVDVLHTLFPSLTLWSDEKYYESFTKAIYLTIYKKVETETDEQYLRKIFSRLDGESESDYWKRILLIERTFPDYTCWYNKENLNILNVSKTIAHSKSVEDLTKRINMESRNSDFNNVKLQCLKIFFGSSSKSSSQSESYLSMSYDDTKNTNLLQRSSGLKASQYSPSSSTSKSTSSASSYDSGINYDINEDSDESESASDEDSSYKSARSYSSSSSQSKHSSSTHQSSKSYSTSKQIQYADI